MRRALRIICTTALFTTIAIADDAHPSHGYTPRELFIQLGRTLVLNYDGEPLAMDSGTSGAYVRTLKLDVDGSGCEFRNPMEGQKRAIACVLKSTTVRAADNEVVQDIDLARALWRAIVASGEWNPTGKGGRIMKVIEDDGYCLADIDKPTKLAALTCSWTAKP